MIMSITRSSRNPRLPQLQPLSARYNLIKKTPQNQLGWDIRVNYTEGCTSIARWTAAGDGTVLLQTTFV